MPMVGCLLDVTRAMTLFVGTCSEKNEQLVPPGPPGQKENVRKKSRLNTLSTRTLDPTADVIRATGAEGKREKKKRVEHALDADGRGCQGHRDRCGERDPSGEGR